MKPAKITIEEIKELQQKCETFYEPLWKCFEDDEKYFELDFKSLLNLPKEFQTEGITLPTARDVVDTYVDHVDLNNARVTVTQQGNTQADFERQQLMRKFFLGMIYRTNVESDISPWRVAGKHHGLHGMGVFKTVYDADRWPDKPEQGEKVSDSEYAERLDQWRYEKGNSLPIVIQAVNPHCIMPDPSYGGRQFVIEKHPRLLLDIRERYPNWSNPKGRKIAENVEFVSYWDAKYRCDMADGEPLLKVKGGVAQHSYGFIPYTIIDAGLGNLSYDNKPEMRYVGILRYIKDLLIAESRDFSIADIILARVSWGGGFLEGDKAKEVTELSQKFGEYTPLPVGVKVIQNNQQIPPEMLNRHLARTSDYIAAHAAPRSVRGLSEEGVRSGADRRLVISEAAARYRYSTEAFRYGTAQVLIKCARLFKNVIPGDIQVWAKTPTDEFDVEIKKDKLKEPFTCYVEFAPISEEDEYRRHDDMERLLAQGVVTPKWARSQMSNVDPIAMDLDEEIQKLKNDPMLQGLVSQYAAGKLAAAISKRTGGEAIPGLAQGATPVAPPQPGQPEAGRQLIAPIPQKAQPGTAEDIQNKMKQMRSQTSMSPTQGRGVNAGGNKP